MRHFAGDTEPTDIELRDAPVHRPRPSVLEAALTSLSGVGPKLAEAAAEAGIATIGDLLLRFPHSHRDRTVVPVAELEPGDSGTIRVEVLGNAPRPFRRRGLSITSVKVGDDSGSLRASWFNQPWIAPKLTPGSTFLLTGSRDKRGFRVSEYEILSTAGGGDVGGVEDSSARSAPSTSPSGPAAVRLVPVHPATERLKAQTIRKWVEQAIPMAGNLLEALPAEMRARRGWRGLPMRSRRSTSRRASPSRRALSSASSSKSYSSTRRSSPAAGGRAARRARRRDLALPGSWSDAGSSRCPSSRPPASGRPSTRSMAISIPGSRWHDC